VGQRRPQATYCRLAAVLITAVLKKGTTYAGQKILFVTELFGKEYFWMEDGDGTIYLVKLGEDGLPDFS
jgi:hypothetical protein